MSFLYKLVTSTRNWLYNKGIFKSTSFGFPVISIGNLTAGGTGKTPHTEYLVKMLQDHYQVATLSRGYGRSTKGFLLASESCSASDIGDEPMQYFRKFANITVAVGENRVKAIHSLMAEKPETQVILLDDAFQHRAVKPGLSILLTEYNRLFHDNYLMPVGTLRESAKGMKRADIIIITKTPSILSPLERRRIESEIKLLPHQKIYYSYIRYGELTPTWPVSKPLTISKEFYFERKYSILLLTGIANPEPVRIYLKEAGARVELMKFADHHTYTREDIEKIKARYHAITSQNKIILTTEKDYMRLLKSELQEAVQELKIFYLPIEVAFHDTDGGKFGKQVSEFIRNHNFHDQPVLEG